MLSINPADPDDADDLTVAVHLLPRRALRDIGEEPLPYPACPRRCEDEHDSRGGLS